MKTQIQDGDVFLTAETDGILLRLHIETPTHYDTPEIYLDQNQLKELIFSFKKARQKMIGVEESR